MKNFFEIKHMNDFELHSTEKSEEEIKRLLSINNAKLYYKYRFVWKTPNLSEDKEFVHISQYEDYINKHKTQFKNSTIEKIEDISESSRNLTKDEIAILLRDDGQYDHNFIIKWNNQIFDDYQSFKTKQEFYNYLQIMQSGDTKAQITEIIETRRN